MSAETVQPITLREELAILLQDYWDTGVEHGREGQDSEAVSPMRVATKQAIWATVDEMLRRAGTEGEE